MGVALGASHFVEHQISRNLEQPGGELRSRDIAAGAFPNPDENLLGNVLYVRITAEHSSYRPTNQRLVSFDQRLEGVGIAARYQTHQADVFRIISGSRRCFWVGH